MITRKQILKQLLPGLNKLFGLKYRRIKPGETMSSYLDVFPRVSHADFVNPSFKTQVRRYFYQNETPRLETVVNKPYAGSGGKEFPLGHRRYGRRRYYVENKGTVTIKLNEQVLGYVHTDDSFTFTSKPYFGDQALLNRLFPSFCLFSSSRRGGVVLTNRPLTKYSQLGKNGSVVHPVFPGLRVYLNDLRLHESCNYYVNVKRLDTKITKLIRKKYEDEFKAARGFFMAASAQNIVADMPIGPHLKPNPNIDNNDMYTQVVRKVEMSCRPWNFSHRANRLYELIDRYRSRFFEQARKSILDEIYEQEQAFKIETIEAGKPIPSGNWGYVIHTDKQEN